MSTQDKATNPGGAEGVSRAGTTRPADQKTQRPKEIGGPKGLEPTRYGDWEKNGRCIDF